jgi:hypothetical protein
MKLQNLSSRDFSLFKDKIDEIYDAGIKLAQIEGFELSAIDCLAVARSGYDMLMDYERRFDCDVVMALCIMANCFESPIRLEEQVRAYKSGKQRVYWLLDSVNAKNIGNTGNLMRLS